MPRDIEDLSEHEKNTIIKIVYDVMYVERDGDVASLNPDKEVNGADLVDTVNTLFINHDVAPRDDWTPHG